MDKEAKAAYMKDYHLRNREERNAKQRAYREKHREYYLKKDKEWRTKNKPLKNAHNAKRRAARLNRTPPWAALDRIEEMYELAQLATEVSGEAYHVDHIVPLQGTHVSGLHIHENLQVIPAIENLRKGNKV